MDEVPRDRRRNLWVSPCAVVAAILGSRIGIESRPQLPLYEEAHSVLITIPLDHNVILVEVRSTGEDMNSVQYLLLLSRLVQVKVAGLAIELEDTSKIAGGSDNV